MPKHWATDYFLDEDLAPRPGDEAFFMQVELVGIKSLVEQFCPPPHPDAHYVSSSSVTTERTVLEEAARKFHAQKAWRGVWVRYEIWRDKQQLLTRESN